jgi:hypothetical protein
MSVQAPVHPSTPAGPTRRLRLLALVIIVLLVLALVIVVVQVKSGGGGDDQKPVTFPLGGRDTAVVQIDSGADQIVVTAADLGSDLASVSTPDGEQAGVRPRAELNGDRLRVWTEKTSDPDDGAKAQINVRIARGVRWDVGLTQGARTIQLALDQAKVRTLDLSGGADQADVTLPAPDGELIARLNTGVGQMRIHAPTGVPTKVTFAAGAGQAVIDGAVRNGIPAGTTIYGASGKKAALGEKGYTAATNRVMIDLKAGLGNFSVDRTQPKK